MPHDERSEHAVSSSSPYDILGVTTDASESEVKQAYQRLARQYHPDSSSSCGHEGDSVSFDRVMRAYNAIRQPEARARHDATVRAAEMAGAASSARILEVLVSDLCFSEGDEEEADGEGAASGMADASDGSATALDSGTSGGIWHYDCRCGDEFTLSATDLAAAASSPIPCRSCSLVLRVRARAEPG